ncbi:hypothetical protein Pla123a_49050 [Posidoniimonas polymericola]|uniref:Uncharacterized protein n=1 Tax=Posidoniimonas polymericola TaxID=2528002 RepID=A0A5C5XQH2_9BACT|nr:hypothetical protein [Posidoniimonas polymericola]TWT65437.1 hypothetical protein Pla123a_49050 [Posidoniimonas polymericola]
MPRTRLLTFVCLCLVMGAGCQSSLKSVARATTGRLDPPNIAGRAPTPEAPPAGPTPLVEPTREEAFASVLGDLQEIGRTHPEAQRQLVAQLDKSDPAHWDGLVQRMKSGLEYRQELAGESATSSVMQTSSQSPAAAGQHSTTNYASHTSAPLPQQPSTWPATPQLPGAAPSNAAGVIQPASQIINNPYMPAATQPAAGQGAESRRFDPELTQTAASGAMYQQGTAEHRSAPYPVTTPSTAAAQPVSFAASASQPPASDAAAEPNTPAEPTTPASWDESLQASIDQLKAELHDRPQSIDEAYQHVRLRLLQLAAGNPDDAASAAPGLTATEQQYWSHQMLTISTLLDNESQPEVRRRAAAGGLHLQHAVTALEQLGSLTVGHLRFCKEVYGFGAYEPLKQARFKPGEEVKVYAEVANFKTVTTAEGEHTSLATSYRVLDQHGSRVDGGEVPVVNDYCASRRRDFHIQYGITLPRAIYPGEYVLELTLTDQLGDKIGHGTIDFTIGADGQ